MEIISFRNVWEMFQIRFMIEGKAVSENFWALRDVTFSVGEGETIGIIGENGAGKSTLLKLVAGMIKPDRGEVSVRGSVSGLLELGAGFQQELTGRENVLLCAGLFGLNQEQIAEKYREIVDFASIGRFIHAPVKCYSQGMFVRLAFAVAIHMNPDILVIDDTLAVGDEYFQRKCLKRVFELRDRGKAIVFVTHDMGMLARLCSRAILLKEGRVVKDDTVAKVVPLYSQSSGVREGIAVISVGELQVIFNNGRLFINRGGVILTPDSGGYFSLLAEGGKWYGSHQAEWDARRVDERTITARGRLFQLDADLVWKISARESGDIGWDIGIETRGPVEILEGLVTLMLPDRYTRWRTSGESGEFPAIDDNAKEWLRLIDRDLSVHAIVVEAPDGALPALGVIRCDPAFGDSTHVLNTDYLTNCRALQFRTRHIYRLSTRQAGHFVCFSGIISPGVVDTARFLESAEKETVLQSSGVRLSVEGGRGVLSAGGRQLTSGDHIHSAVHYQGRWYFSTTASWEVRSRGNNTLTVAGRWPGLPVSLVWEVAMREDGSVFWKAGLDVEKPVDIEQQHLYLSADGDYSRWSTAYGEGWFPGGFTEIETDILQKCIPEGPLSLKGARELPEVSVAFSPGRNSFAKIFNSSFYAKSRIIRLEKVEPERNVTLAPGFHPAFEAGICVRPDADVDGAPARRLGGEPLELVFSDGRGCLYWKGKEITKRLGLYTSLRCGGRWYDSSSSALWKTEHSGADVLVAMGRWLRLPVAQKWVMTRRDQGSIGFEVTMEFFGEMELDRMQANLMLSERYSRWSVENRAGVFPEFNGDTDDDWDLVWSGEAVAVSAYGGEGEGLPGVCFSHAPSPGWGLAVVNSDLYHRGRVLQSLCRDDTKFSPGTYRFFSGIITVA